MSLRSPGNGMTLDSPLGTWHALARNTWFPVYRTEDRLFYSEANKIQVLCKAPTAGFFHFQGMADSIPVDAHPSSYTQIGESIWTRRKHHLMHPEITDLPPGHVIKNTLCNPNIDTLVTPLLFANTYMGTRTCAHRKTYPHTNNSRLSL